jgi:hypothetical protein
MFAAAGKGSVSISAGKFSKLRKKEIFFSPEPKAEENLF